MFWRSDDEEDTLDEPAEHTEKRRVYTITYTDGETERVYADRMFEDRMIRFFNVRQMELSITGDFSTWTAIKERSFFVNHDEVRSIDVGDTITKQTFRGSTEGIYDPIED